jgi:hypothetical protein
LRLYPADVFSTLQQEMAQMALGAAYWSDKKSKYTIERTLAKRARDMGMLTGGGDSDPATLQAMFLEMLCERSEFIIQVRGGKRFCPKGTALRIPLLRRRLQSRHHTALSVFLLLLLHGYRGLQTRSQR